VRPPAWHHLRAGGQQYLAEQLEGAGEGAAGTDAPGGEALQELLPASTLFFGVRGAQVGFGR
jgi:hypothetical protein